MKKGLNGSKWHGFMLPPYTVIVYKYVERLGWLIRKPRMVWRYKMVKYRVFLMGGLVISRAAFRALSAHRRTTEHITVASSVLCTGYVVNKAVSCVLMNMILVIII
jgi:hypothetical protein